MFFSIKPVLVTIITKKNSYGVKNKFIYLQIEFSFRVSNCNSKKKIFDLNLEKQVVIFRDSVTGMFFHF